jgi:hypothetical protein
LNPSTILFFLQGIIFPSGAYVHARLVLHPGGQCSILLLRKKIFCGNTLLTSNGILQHSETKSDEYHLSNAFYLRYLNRKWPKPCQTLPQQYFANHASDTPRAIPVNCVNNDDNHANNNNVDANEAAVAEAGETNLANDDVNTNYSNEVVEFRVAKLADKRPHPPPRRTLTQQTLPIRQLIHQEMK